MPWHMLLMKPEGCSGNRNNRCRETSIVKPIQLSPCVGSDNVPFQINTGVAQPPAKGTKRPYTVKILPVGQHTYLFTAKTTRRAACPVAERLASTPQSRR